MSDSAVAIRLDASGRIELALSAIGKSPHEYRGYVMTAREDALFVITRDARDIELRTTAGAQAWSRAWRIHGDSEPEYRMLGPAIDIAQPEFDELANLAQNFVAQWIWFRQGPHEETAIEAQRFSAMGCAIDDANVRSAALARVRGGVDTPVCFSELAAEAAWIEDAIARCWPGSRGR